MEVDCSCGCGSRCWPLGVVGGSTPSLIGCEIVKRRAGIQIIPLLAALDDDPLFVVGPTDRTDRTIV